MVHRVPTAVLLIAAAAVGTACQGEAPAPEPAPVPAPAAPAGHAPAATSPAAAAPAVGAPAVGAAKKPLTIKGLDGDEVVTIQAEADDEALRIVVKVQPGYHLYPPGSSDGVPVAVTVGPGGAFAAAGALVAPTSPHLEGTVRLTQPLKRTGPGDALSAKFTWQACDAQMCFPPLTVTIER